MKMKWLLILLLSSCAKAEVKDVKQYRTIFGEGNKALAQLNPDGKTIAYLNDTKPEEVIYTLVAKISELYTQINEVQVKQQGFETEVRRIFNIDKKPKPTK